MRAAFPSLSVCLLAAMIARAGEWKLIAPAPAASHLRTMALTPGGHPLAMGSFGNAAASGNGGATWHALRLPTGRTVSQAMFRDGVGHAAGLGGTLLVSRDGGTVWTEQASGVTRDLHGIDFLDGSRGFACGDGTLLRTEDGGTTWLAVQADRPTNWRRVAMLGAASLVLAGTDGLYLSRDGGATLAKTLSHAIPFESLDFADSLAGFAASYATLWRTRDGGATWDSVFYTSVIIGVQAFSPESVYVFGPSGVRGRSTDGGSTWDTDFDWEPRDLLDARFADPLTGYGAGNHGNIYVTGDGGRTWAARHRPGPPRLLSVPRFFDGRAGYVLGDAGPLRTEDGGHTWQADSGAVVSLARNGFHLVDAQVGYGVGNGGTLIRTRDAGRSWTRLETGTTRALVSAWFTHPDTGWVAGKGAGGPILKTVDGGRHWQAQVNPTQSPLTLIRFRDARRGYALAGNDLLLSTHNGGKDWIASPMGFPHAPDYLDLEGNEVMYARGVADSGALLLKSGNGGASWTALPLADDVQAFNFFHPDTGYAVGAARGYERQGVILRTMDGGASWTRMETATPELNRIFFPARGEAVATGPYGTVLAWEGEGSAQAVSTLPRRGRRGLARPPAGLFARPGGGSWFDALGARARR